MRYAYDFNGPALNSYLHVNEHAAAEARQLDRLRRRTSPGPLYGIPVLLKDNVNTADMPTTAGSMALAGSIPRRDAFIARRLRNAGAVILGKATLTEFANFLTNGMPGGYSSLGGYGFNPYDPRPLPGGDGRPVLSPGGSSSGSGIAPSANLTVVSIGTETSGSILSPSGANGIVGIKPTVGLVSREGIIPITADQDTAGPMARTVTDAAIVLGVIAGYDRNDPATRACLEPGNCYRDYTRFLRRNALKGARIAVRLSQSRGALDAVYKGPDGEWRTDDDIDALLNPGAGTPARAGYPSISVPGGFLPPDGEVVNERPSAIVYSGPAFSEPHLIGLGYAYEQLTKHRRPPASTPALPSDTLYKRGSK